MIYTWNGEAGSLSCTGSKALPGWTVIHKEQELERNEKTEEKPVSLSVFEVKWCVIYYLERPVVSRRAVYVLW